MPLGFKACSMEREEEREREREGEREKEKREGRRDDPQQYLIAVGMSHPSISWQAGRQAQFGVSVTCLIVVP